MNHYDTVELAEIAARVAADVEMYDDADDRAEVICEAVVTFRPADGDRFIRAVETALEGR